MARTREAAKNAKNRERSERLQDTFLSMNSLRSTISDAGSECRAEQQRVRLRCGWPPEMETEVGLPLATFNICSLLKFA